MGQGNGYCSVQDMISSLPIYDFLEYERAPGGRSPQAEKVAVLDQTCHAEQGRPLAVTLKSSHGFDLCCLEIDELGEMVPFLTVLAEFLLFFSTP